MSIFFSASTMGFYDEAELEFFKNWPGDAVIITEEEHIQFISPAPGGKILGSKDGMPVWVDKPAPTHEQLVSQAEQQKSQLRKAADSEIAWLQDAVDAGIASDEEMALLVAWKKYRALLMRIDTSKAPDIEWPPVPAVA